MVVAASRVPDGQPRQQAAKGQVCAQNMWRRARRPFLATVYPGLAQWRWYHANPYRWNVYGSNDGGATWALDGYVTGTVRQYDPASGLRPFFVVGVDAGGSEVTGRSNVVRPDDARMYEVGGIEVALKALPPELSHNAGEMEEVRENFQLVSKLAHQHIAAVRNLERDASSGDYYLILELVEGMDLRRWRKQQGSKLSLAQALPILRQVAQALDYAHSQKIIHRDIKPSNVMVSPDGTVKVLDFGLAAQIQSSLSRVSQVHYGTSGTGPYMAPEQWRGHRQDGGTDQYALAVVVYELLAGHLPFEGHEVTILREAVLRDAPVQIEELRAKVWSALARGLAKDRTQR